MQDLQGKVEHGSSLAVETHGSEESSGCRMSFVEVSTIGIFQVADIAGIKIGQSFIHGEDTYMRMCPITCVGVLLLVRVPPATAVAWQEKTISYSRS